MHKIIAISGGGIACVEDEVGNRFHRSPSWRNESKTAEIKPLSEVHPMELQGIGPAVDNYFIAGIIGERTDLTEDDIERISKFVHALYGVYLTKDCLNRGFGGEENNAIYREMLINEEQRLGISLKELRSDFDIEVLLSRFDIHKEARRALYSLSTKSDVANDEEKEFSDREIAFTAQLLIQERNFARAFNVRMAAELALFLKKPSESATLVDYYNTVVRRLGVLSERCDRMLDIKTGEIV